MQEDLTQLDPKVVKVMSALKRIESGGDYNAVGDNGESHGAYQFNKGNWNAWAGQYLGDTNAPMTSANQNKLMYARIKQQKDDGLQPEEIAAIHNGAHKEGGQYVYNNPEYGNKFRQSIAQASNSGYQTQPNLPPAGPPQPQGDKGLVNQLGERGQSISNAIGLAGTGVGELASGSVGRGLIDVGSGALQSVGHVAGGIGDVIGAGLGLIPGVKQVEQKIGEGVGALAQTPLGQKAIQGGESFAQKHPVLAGDIGAIGNIGGLVLGGVGAKLGKEAIGQGLKTATREGVLGAGLQGVAERRAFSQASELLGSTPTKTEVKSAIRTGRLTNKSGVPGIVQDPVKQDSTKAVSNMIMEGKLPSKALAGEKANLIKQEADTTAENMRNLIKGQEIQPIVQPEEFAQLEQNVVKRAGESAVSGENPAEKLLSVFKKNLPQSGDITAEDVLNARQAVSRFVLENKGDWSTRGVYTGFKSARDAFWDESRTMLKTLAPGVPIEQMLAKQSALYRALDYIVPKVKSELGTTRVSRFVKRHPHIKSAIRTTTHYGLGGLIGGAVASHYLGE